MAPTYSVLIARMQPCHNAHLAIMKHALKKRDRLLVCIGSSRQARSPKNPFNAAERIEIIKSALTPDEVSRTEFLPIRDYLYNDNMWLTDIQRRVKSIVEIDPGPITICGRLKDRTSYYMRLFPQWACDEYPLEHPVDATKVRRALIEDDMHYVAESVPEPVYQKLIDWRATEAFQWVLEEQRFYDEYKLRHNPSGLPYEQIFQTADCVVVQAGHVLLINRRSAPGKGLVAIPGGFINRNETIETSAIRELKEETGIDVPKDVLRASIIDRHQFDHPDRSLRGRVITTAHCIKLETRARDDYDLPSVKGSDDAARAMWVPLDELGDYEEKSFEDHIHIVRYFTNKF